jgi:hypothetical protein
MRIIFAFLAMFSVLAAGGAFAATTPVIGETGESFAIPTFREIAQMIVMMDGVDIKNPKVADDYAKLMFCGLYREKFKNDFEWDKVRQQIINRVQSKKDYYRQQYELAGSFNLDRYNFDTQDFPLTPKTAMSRVGSMILYDASVEPKIRILCKDDAFTKVFPAVYLFVLEQPLTFDRLKLPVDEAKALLERMNVMKNRDRRLYVRFRIHVTGIESVRGTKSENNIASIRGDITDIDIFHDAAMTKWLTKIHFDVNR